MTADSHNGQPGERLSIESAIGLIKKKLFDAGDIDSRSYNKSVLVEVKNKHDQFPSLDKEEWFTAFRRAASEYILKKDKLKGDIATFVLHSQCPK